jgi:hypothetical protein
MLEKKTKPGCKKLLNSFGDNEKMLEANGFKKVKFEPSIPNLLFHYNFFTNYESKNLNEFNKEIENIKLNHEDKKDDFITVKEHDEEERKVKTNIHWSKNKHMEELDKKENLNVKFFSNEIECIPYGILNYFNK